MPGPAVAGAAEAIGATSSVTLSGSGSTGRGATGAGGETGFSVGSGRDLRDHGWFVFFAPRDNPQIAGVIFGEHNEHGYLNAPIAKHVVETYFAKKEGLPLPTLKPVSPPAPVAPRPVEPDPDSVTLDVAPIASAAPATAGPGTN